MNFCCIQLFRSYSQFTWNLWRLQFGYSFLIFSFFFSVYSHEKKNEWRTKGKKRMKLMFDVLGCAQYMYRQNSIIRHPSCWVRWILLTLQYDVEIPSKFDYYILKRFTLYPMCRNGRWKKTKELKQEIGKKIPHREETQPFGNFCQTFTNCVPKKTRRMYSSNTMMKSHSVFAY